MDFKAFDTTKMDEYSRRAKEQWGQTTEYREYEKKAADQTAGAQASVMDAFMRIFAEFGQMKELNPSDARVQALVEKLQRYITEHFYTCSRTVLSSLGQMYAADGEFSENIDAAGGKGTAEFTAKAIEVFCRE